MSEIIKQYTLGSREVIILKKCSSGVCIGVTVAVDEGFHIINITKTGSDFVHPCDQTYNCEHNKAWIPVPGQSNAAQWLGWTDAHDPSQAFDLHVEFEADAETREKAAGTA